MSLQHSQANYFSHAHRIYVKACVHWQGSASPVLAPHTDLRLFFVLACRLYKRECLEAKAMHFRRRNEWTRVCANIRADFEDARSVPSS